MKTVLSFALYLAVCNSVHAQSASKSATDTTHHVADVRMSDLNIDTSYSKVEIESKFPGGQQGWIKYLSENFHYPAKAVRKNIQGTVVVQFIVDKQGKVTNAQVIRSVDPLLDEEALRLIQNSPDWTPAVQNGKKVKSYKKQPVVFRLEEEQPKKKKSATL